MGKQRKERRQKLKKTAESHGGVLKMGDLFMFGEWTEAYEDVKGFVWGKLLVSLFTVTVIILRTLHF